MNDRESPDNRVAPKELPGSAGTPRSTGREHHRNSAGFENFEFEASPAQCEVCGCSIPPNRARCSDHRQSKADARSESDYSWSISHVAIAVVPGSNIYHAVAIASSAFKLRDGGHKTTDSFDLIYDFDEPSQTLTSSWGGDLPGAVPLNSDTGERLLEQGIEKSDWGSTLDVEEMLGVEESPLSSTEPYIYVESGDAVTSKEQVEELQAQSGEGDSDLWVVPGVLYERQRDTSGETVQHRDCPSCGSTTRHVFDGYENGHPSLHTDGVAVWLCLECDSKNTGSAPVGDSIDEPWADEDYAGGDRYTVEDAAEAEHHDVMERLDQEGELE